jgi:hypothetical protein
MFEGLNADSVTVTEFVATPPGDVLPGLVGGVGVVFVPPGEVLSELPPHAVIATAIVVSATRRQ